LKAYHNLIGSLLLFQIIALFFSVFGQSSSMINDYVTITNDLYSGDIIITFTLLWIFTISFYVTNRASKKMMFSFITSKLSNHIANALFMLCLCVLGAVSSVLLGVVMRVAVIFYYGVDKVSAYESLTIPQLFLTILVVFLYHVLLFSFGYVIGETIQLHISFTFLIPLLLFGLLIFTINVFNEAYMFTFYMMESNLFIFIVKVVGSAVIFWLIAIQIGRRLEVRLS